MSKKYDNYKIPDEEVKVIQKLLPEGLANNSLGKQVPEYIVIHEVSLGIGRSPKNFDMDHYANKILKDGLEGSTIGYHFLVGDKSIYQFIKEDQRTHHTGTIEGNQNSIGVERLICEGINYDYALHNQAKLIATLMVKWNIPMDHVVTHKKMQIIYEPNHKSYTLRVNFNNANEDLLPSLRNEYELVLKMYRDNLELLSDKQKQSFEKNLSKINIKENLTYKNLIYQLFLLVSIESEINKEIAKSKNIEYQPIVKELAGVKFFETIEPKKCPNRLLVGQRGGLEKFYREIEKCLKHQMFFDDVFELDNYNKRI